VQQATLAQLLGEGWFMEFVVPTCLPRINPQRIPTHYKLDIAYPPYKVAVEVQGGSHGTLSAQNRDLKKRLFLEKCGWTVLSFTNKEVTEHLEECALTVMSTILALPVPTLT
jgi:very-short-patch-repair endonuclease